MKLLQISAVGVMLLTATPSMGSVLKTKVKSKTHQKGFFGDLAKGLAVGAAGAALGAPMMSPQAQQMQGLSQGISADMQKADSLQTRQQILEKKLQNELDALNKIKSEVEYMKQQGLLEKPKSVKALQAPPTTSEAMKALAAGQPSPLGGALEDYEAPIIFLEPPPISPSQMIEASESAEATLQRIGDESSPVMKAIKEYENKKLGIVNANNLEETRQEIKQTESAIQKRKIERSELVNKLKEKGRVLAKTGSKRLQQEALFANNDLKEKDRQLDILANKLTVLKKKEKNLIQMEGPGEAAKAEEEAEETEEEELEE